MGPEKPTETAVKPLEAWEQPFSYLISEEATKYWTTYCNDEAADRESYEKGQKINEQRGFIRLLGLNALSTAGEIRQRADSLMLQIYHKGITIRTIKALEWALTATKDCANSSEFLKLLYGYDLGPVFDTRGAV